MPLAGINCDIRNEKVSFIECLACDKCNNFPIILKKKFLFPSFRHSPPRVSVTSLIGCVRQNVLKLTKDFYFDRSVIIALNLGSAIHEYLADTSDITEKYLRWVTPEGKECMGYLDTINISRRVLYDIKTTSSGEFIRGRGANEKDMLQLQIYATILKKFYGVDLHGLKLVYVGLGDKDCHEIEVPFIDQTEFINKRVNLVNDFLGKKEVPKGIPMWKWECQLCAFKQDCPDKILT